MSKALFLSLFVSILIFIFFITVNINLPYVGPNATNFNVYSLIAHNFNKFGYLETKLAPIISVSEKYPANPEYFFHHPTLLSFTESILFKIFGEQFWVGRLTVILFSLGSLFLIYLIGKNLLNETFGAISALVFTLIPASTIWGKMIGQEPLVLFFCLAALYCSLIFLEKKENKYLILAGISLILGTLSDWPAIIFAFSLIFLFRKYSEVRKYSYVLVVAVGMFLLLLFYTYFLRNGFWDLQNAIGLRTALGLSKDWLFFLPTQLIRILIYLNSLFVLFTIAVGLYIYKKNKFKNLDKTSLTLLVFFSFFLIHQLLYAQAVFSHNYLLYYSIPFFAFGSSYLIYILYTNKRYTYLSLAILTSFIYLIVISDYKNKQVESNLWRYEFAQKISSYIPKYETVVLNQSYSVDPDLLWYPFSINVMVSDDKSANFYSKNYKYYIYSCIDSCPTNIKLLNTLGSEHKTTRIKTTQAEAYVIYLNEKKNDEDYVFLKTSPSNLLDGTFVKKIYNNLRSLLYTSQI
ncbi:MAG: hypothetical protein A3B38_01335 [Candidatus Levybacteria bacterium RIFCSPLOWO2_01_FULL_36_13]|nr:MAG: hypothetical protein A2684_02570 [Candidatus Levybacteria bacterium RIFCSPHIGHO2_01_FULL_36_15b]OGH35521.1 MAG: hypothetical protein A3B38_01335 [Candidatus Levybacteria bacterium RIFCSPLOWO2_01_FULL_36_13]